MRLNVSLAASITADGREHGNGDDDDGGQDAAPVFEEEVEDDDGKEEADHDRFPDAADGVVHEEGLVVVEGQFEVGRERAAKIGELGFQVLGDLQDAGAGGLGADIQQHRAAALGVDDVEDGLGSALDARDVGDAHGMALLHGDDEIFEVGGVLHAAIHEREVDGVVLHVEPGGPDEIVFFERGGDVGHREVGGGEFERIDDDVVFGGAATDEIDARDAGDAEEARLEIVAGEFPQFGEFAFRAGETDAENREGVKREPPDGGLGGLRQGGLELRNAVKDVELALDHVDLPVEEDVDLGAAATGGGAHLDDAGNVLHRLLDGARDGGHHLVGGHDAVVDEDDAAGKLRLGKNRGRHLERAEHAAETHGERDENNRHAMTHGERAGAGGRAGGVAAHLAASLAGAGEHADFRFLRERVGADGDDGGAFGQAGAGDLDEVHRRGGRPAR
jgi:hypothetical protein